MASADMGDYLICVICLNTYTDPAGLACGHNFCWVCINRLLDRQDQSRVYSCPSCRRKFEERPETIRNVTLQRTVEKCLSTQPTCIEASGEKHLEVPNTSDPSTNTEHKCFLHKKTFAYYCTEDKSIICADCSAEDHREHLVEIMEEAAEKRKVKCSTVYLKLTEHKWALGLEIDDICDQLRNLHEKAHLASDMVNEQFLHVWKQVIKTQNRITSEILQKVKDSRKLSYLINEQKIKLDKVISRLRHIKKLCNTTDAQTVLQDPETGDLCKPEGKGDEDSGGHDRPGYAIDGVNIDELTNSIQKLDDTVQYIKLGIYLDNSVLTLNIDTASKHLIISDNKKSAGWAIILINRTETPERFLNFPQVMSNQKYSSGKHYWDVQGSPYGILSSGMCYPSMDRRGCNSLIGCNTKSWCLERNVDLYSAKHNNTSTELPDKVTSLRLRISLDYEAGQLSFYELCNPIKHLHTFNATFTEPLHVVFFIKEGYLNILRETANQHTQTNH